MKLCSTVPLYMLFDECDMFTPKDTDLGQNRREPTNTTWPGKYRGPFGHGCKSQCRFNLYLPCQHAPTMHIIDKSCMSYLNQVPSSPNMKNKISLNSLPSSVCYNLFMLVWLAFISRTRRQRHSISQQYPSSGRLSIYRSFKPDLFLHTFLGNSCLDFWSLRPS